jgi:hypothetical protein
MQAQVINGFFYLFVVLFHPGLGLFFALGRGDLLPHQVVDRCPFLTKLANSVSCDSTPAVAALVGYLYSRSRSRGPARSCRSPYWAKRRHAIMQFALIDIS